MNSILTFGIFQAILLSLFLFRKRKEQPGIYNPLIALLLLSALALFGRVSYQPELIIKYEEFLALPDALIFLFGPLIYFLTRAYIKLEPLKGIHLFVHFIPFIINTVINTLIGLVVAGLITFFGRRGILILYDIVEFSGILSCGLYTIFSIKIYSVYKRKLKENHTFPQLPSFLLFFFIANIILVLFWLSGYLSARISFFPANWAIFAYNTFWILISFFIGGLTYFFLSNSQGILLPQLVLNETKHSDVLYHKSQVQQLREFMNQHLPFLDPKLNLDNLSNLTCIKRHELSAIINTEFKQNFFDFINQHRVKNFIKEYQQAVASNSSTTFIEIAYQSGFNSKSAFNRAFKKVEHMTPSQYFSKVLQS